MALILTLHEGGTLHLKWPDGKTDTLKLLDIEHDTSCRVVVGSTGDIAVVTDTHRVEVLPEVMVSMGPPSSDSAGPTAKLVIDAPRSIIILRSKLLRGKKSKE